MIQVVLKGHKNIYDTRELTKLFVSEVEVLEDIADLSGEENFVISQLEKDALGNHQALAQGNIHGHTANYQVPVESPEEGLTPRERALAYDKYQREALRSTLFMVLRELTGKKPVWGIFTGIRPVKIVQNMLEASKNYQEIFEELTKEKYLKEEKAQLLIDIAKKERDLIYPLEQRAVNIYISIPFCPSRCYYCSFPSNDLHRKDREVQEYLTNLHKELEASIKILNQKNIKVNTLYVGGGTPSILNRQQFEDLFTLLKELQGYSRLQEITVEAGRPDTFSVEVLQCLKDQGVGRISLNPQTMNQETLVAIGRKHSPEEIHRAYEMIQKVGFDSVNMDLIVGLPGETAASLDHTLKEIEKLQPENLTVHTLAVKTNSYFKEHPELLTLGEEGVLSMLKKVEAFTEDQDYTPYYMYRQKNMLGNFENVGYSKRGKESLYNMKIMSEKETILGFGAGAVSKVVNLETDEVQRVPNIKGLGHYMDRIDEALEKKKEILERF
ncbi:coproporphyrinogen dehydrogenase HemZ [Isachenkonia alkalipeptolytica]|uniref:Coproporphyrinogen dehydrogenase HemZ n=1 Tax=Isachenkonia alkalipeptolytica TaxID=2565777 RepID=A0AA43XLQ7_9CLOT|nr:coproporphyrinogen dehydrogenase HemZ [Isachenkonia alkalipeptolytica]NBG89153.1 coproporphyrinogen dehydrogenase HemZ [Isachenkonia alkalipeptolytica]